MRRVKVVREATNLRDNDIVWNFFFFFPTPLSRGESYAEGRRTAEIVATYRCDRNREQKVKGVAVRLPFLSFAETRGVIYRELFRLRNIVSKYPR